MSASRKSVPGSTPTGPAGHKLKVVENGTLEIYDYPGEALAAF
jgi:hypothetical protein